tara:strand:- start:1 stop:156 length:156 start_codon:yes stop_codon:yes gene_type:complete
MGAPKRNVEKPDRVLAFLRCACPAASRTTRVFSVRFLGFTHAGPVSSGNGS